MKVRVIRSFRDKDTKEAIRKGREIEISEERFSELNAGPLGTFVEELKDDHVPDNLEMTFSKMTFSKMTKAELIKYAESIDIELIPGMAKNEMIEILMQK